MDPLSRPIFVVAPPQSGTTFVYDSLSRLDGISPLGGEGRRLLERSEELHPASRGHDSNRRTAADASPETAEALRDGLRAVLPTPEGSETRRMLDASPRNALRVPFLDAVFPDASFVYVYREPRLTLPNMAEAWHSGEYVTYPQLPDWSGPPWSLLLVPNWRSLAGKTIVEIVAEQWVVTTRTLLEDLEELPPERWCVADYAALVADPGPELERVCSFLDVEWDDSIELGRPRAYTAKPSAEAQERRSERLQAVLPATIGLAERARDLIADPVSRRPTVTPDADSPLRSVYTGGFARLLERSGVSLLVTTYDSGRLVCVRRDGPRVNTHFRKLDRPTGIAAYGDELAVGTRAEVWRYRDSAEAASGPDGSRSYDAYYLPRSRHFTGDVLVHELAYAGDELWIVATGFSCLGTLDETHSFVPRWRPAFVSELADEDRCHLTGLAIADGRPAYVTALGQTDSPAGWREDKLEGGCVVEVESSEVIADGLCLPHSPRWHDDRLWFLESGEGALCSLDPQTGERETVAELPGFARGLALAGGLAYVGLSRLRPASVARLPVAARFEERFCGIWIVDLESGTPIGYLRFEGEVNDVFDVVALAGRRYPEVADPTGEAALRTFSLP